MLSHRASTPEPSSSPRDCLEQEGDVEVDELGNAGQQEVSTGLSELEVDVAERDRVQQAQLPRHRFRRRPVGVVDRQPPEHVDHSRPLRDAAEEDVEAEERAFPSCDADLERKHRHPVHEPPFVSGGVHQVEVREKVVAELWHVGRQAEDARAGDEERVEPGACWEALEGDEFGKREGGGGGVDDERERHVQSDVGWVSRVEDFQEGDERAGARSERVSPSLALEHVQQRAAHVDRLVDKLAVGAVDQPLVAQRLVAQPHLPHAPPPPHQTLLQRHQRARLQLHERIRDARFEAFRVTSQLVGGPPDLEPHLPSSWNPGGEHDGGVQGGAVAQAAGGGAEEVAGDVGRRATVVA
eukprot:768484-Hanusia_phi.AAC.3